VIEVVREIGVLLLAFTPLEFTLQRGAASGVALWVFVATGAALVGISLYAEARR
jgi:hypothetical protein